MDRWAASAEGVDSVIDALLGVTHGSALTKEQLLKQVGDQAQDSQQRQVILERIFAQSDRMSRMASLEDMESVLKVGNTVIRSTNSNLRYNVWCLLDRVSICWSICWSTAVVVRKSVRMCKPESRDCSK